MRCALILRNSRFAHRSHWTTPQLTGLRHPPVPWLPPEKRRVTNQLCATLLWQGRFFDRALRTVKEYSETVEYIHRNPVRRGRVARPEDWRWSSAHEYGPPGSVPPLGWPPLRIDRVRIPADPKARI